MDVSYKEQVSDMIQHVLGLSEIDIGVSWKNGLFVPTGAKLLDDRLVNDALNWLRGSSMSNVLMPFEKGLALYMRSLSDPRLHSDVVTDMYEALEAMAKAITGRPTKDLSANMEPFLSKLALGEHFRQLLKDYIAMGNVYRHAGKGDGKPMLSRGEVEGFIYLTGTFLRLALVSLKP